MPLSSESLREAELQLRGDLLTQLKNTADESSSAGDFCLHFIRSVAWLVGPASSLPGARRDTIRTLCELVEERPFPALVWARLIPRYFDDVPFLANALEGVLTDKRHLLQEIGGVTAKHAEDIGLHKGARVVIQGYSGTIPGILAALSEEVKPTLQIFATQQNHRGINEGELLRLDLEKRGYNVAVVEDQEALRMLEDSDPQRKIDTFIMGAKAIGLYRGELCVINTYSPQQLPAVARKAGATVLVISGRYKMWPQDLFGEYAEKVDQSERRFDSVIQQEIITWVATEGGPFRPGECHKAYQGYLSATMNTIPGWSPGVETHLSVTDTKQPVHPRPYGQEPASQDRVRGALDHDVTKQHSGPSKQEYHLGIDQLAARKRRLGIRPANLSVSISEIISHNRE